MINDIGPWLAAGLAGPHLAAGWLAAAKEPSLGLGSLSEASIDNVYIL